MSGEDVLNTFQEKLYECNKHIEKIEVSKNYLASYMPMSLEAYLALDEVTLSFIDRLIYRFFKLQDTMGEKIFPAVLLLAQEDVKKKTFVDIPGESHLNSLDDSV